MEARHLGNYTEDALNREASSAWKTCEWVDREINHEFLKMANITLQKVGLLYDHLDSFA